MRAKMFTAQRLEAARGHAAAQLALAESFPSHDSVGYIILHQARRHLWLIQHWWTDSEILAGPLGRDAEGIFADASAAARRVLEGATIADVIERDRRAAGAAMYHI